MESDEPNPARADWSSDIESTRMVPCAPAPALGLRMSGKPIRLAKSTTWSAVSAAVDAAVGTPAWRRTSFMDGLSRQSHVVRTEAPGMPRASRTCAAAIWWDSIVDSSRSIQPMLWAHSAAALSWPMSVTLETR